MSIVKISGAQPTKNGDTNYFLSHKTTVKGHGLPGVGPSHGTISLKVLASYGRLDVTGDIQTGVIHKEVGGSKCLGLRGQIFILDFWPRFPGKIFCVLKEKEEKQYGEYRTGRLVLEAWDKLEANRKS